jgi:hypothetical protein
VFGLPGLFNPLFLLKNAMLVPAGFVKQTGNPDKAIRVKKIKALKGLMPISKTSVMNSIAAICGKYDPMHHNGKTYRNLKKIYLVEKLSELMRKEINGWKAGSAQVQKNKQVENLKAFFKDSANPANEARPFSKIQGDIADFIGYAQNREEKLLAKKA